MISRIYAGTGLLVACGWWMVAGGRWLVAGGWWLVDGGWFREVRDRCARLDGGGVLLAAFITRACTMPRRVVTVALSLALVSSASAQFPSAVVHLSSTADVRLANGILDYTISDVLRNDGAANAEVIYSLPLPARGAFQSLAMSINGEMISGDVYTAQRARAIYDAIRRTNRDPALVEWLDRDLLRTSIFPIFPGEVKHVDTRLQAVARLERNAIRVDYFVGSSRGQPAKPGGAPVSLTLRYPDSAHYGAAYSNTHVVSSRSLARGTRTVTVSGTGSHITLWLPVRSSEDARISVSPHAVAADSGFALITVTAPALKPRRLPRDVVFVMDASGSMSGERLGIAKAAGRRVLSALHSGDRFRIVTFADNVDYSDAMLVDANSQNIARGLRYLDALNAGGNTNMAAALEEALRPFAAEERHRLPVVLFLTDGIPSIGEVQFDVILERVAAARGRARIFPIGIGAGANPHLIQELARAGSGVAHMSGNGEAVARTAEYVMSNLAAPLVTQLRLSAEGIALAAMYPEGVPDLYAGRSIEILARYTGAGMATLTFEGESVDGPVRWRQNVHLPRHGVDNAAVARLWAAERVGELTAEHRRTCGNADVQNEIRSLGERYSMPTTFTSYLVIEPGVHVDANGRVTNAAEFRTSGGGQGGAVAGGRGGAVGGAGDSGAGGIAARRVGPPRPPSGSDVVIQIRNPLSVAGFTQPLIIVDGVLQLPDDPSIGMMATDRIPDMVPEDIASINIIRGAAAAALYGQRAANGVINIVTRRGVEHGTLLYNRSGPRWRCVSGSPVESPLSIRIRTWAADQLARRYSELAALIAESSEAGRRSPNTSAAVDEEILAKVVEVLRNWKSR
jgi:Ca-activated chloride channel family protein